MQIEKAQLLLQTLRVELATNFRDYPVVFLAAERSVDGGEADLLCGAGYGVHFDLLPLGVIPGMIPHFGEVKITAHQTVDMDKDIENKLRRQSLGVGVSPFQHLDVFGSICPEEQKVLGAHGVGELTEKTDKRSRIEVANGAAQEHE